MEYQFRSFVTALIIVLIILLVSVIQSSEDEVNSQDFQPIEASDRLQVFVSNLDGSLTAIDGKTGDVLWTMFTGTKPLLLSSISDIQMTRNGLSSQLVPSLDGSLYQIDGEGIEPLPLAADILLTSSYKLTDDSSIVGGKELETYGIDVNTGKLLYICTSGGCHQVADLEGRQAFKSSEVLVVKRTDRTIRLVDVIEGREKWNFSVGQLDLSYHMRSDAFPIIAEGLPDIVDGEEKLTNSDDIHPKFNLLNSDCIAIKVKMPTRTLWASNPTSTSHVYWEHQFDSSIAGVWMMKNRELFPISLFENQRLNEGREHRTQGMMYIGVYNNMLYIQPSDAFTASYVSSGDEADDAEEFVQDDADDTQVQVSMPRVKWKPYIATAPSRTRIISDGKAQNDAVKTDPVHGPPNSRDKSLVLLSKNQYPFDSGYYLYLDYSPIEDFALCRNITLSKSRSAELISVLSRKWKQLSLFLFIGLTSLFTFLRRKYHKFKNQLQRHSSGSSTVSKSCSAQHDLMPHEVKRESSKEEFDGSQQQFISRYTTDFQQQECLGKGGFGVVFKAYNKIDECFYAIKRIPLKDSKTAREKVMREVKALAKLDHPGIVRYYQSWLECPPLGWLEKQDNISCHSSSIETKTSNITSAHKRAASMNSTCPKIEVAESSDSIVFDDDVKINIPPTSDEDDSVVLMMENDSIENDATSDDETNEETKSGTVEFESESILIEDSKSFCMVEGSNHESLRRRWTAAPSESSIVFMEDSKKLSMQSPNSSGIGMEVAKIHKSINENDSPKRCDKDPENKGEPTTSQEKPRKLYLYIQMQLCKEESLREWLNDTSFEKDVTYDIFYQIVSAISYVHNQGLMHRDLKPSNIFFAMDGTIKIGDFGLVTDVENICDNCNDFSLHGDKNHPNRIIKKHTNQVGTQLYMSPELSSGCNYTHKVDIYALGVIFFEMFQRFSTHMERVKSLQSLRSLVFPESFRVNFNEEYEFVKPLLSHDPDMRPEANDLLKDKLLVNYEESSNLFRRLHRTRTLSMHSNSSSPGASLDS